LVVFPKFSSRQKSCTEKFFKKEHPGNKSLGKWYWDFITKSTSAFSQDGD